MQRRPRLNRSLIRHLEALEDRQLLTASVADIGDLSPALEAAFIGASDLSQYTDQQLESATRWVVATRQPADLVELADTLGVEKEDITETGFVSNTYSVDVTDYDTSAGQPSFAARTQSLLYGYPIVSKERSLRLAFDDPLFSQQWNLHNTGQVSPTATFDHGFTNAWDEATGEGVVISIVDEGVELDHPDLSKNVVLAASYDFANGDNMPEPFHAFAGHGTAVAGIAAGNGGNAIGITGAAPSASLAAVKLPFSSLTDDDEAAAVSYGVALVDIYNHSWGPNDNGIAEGPGPLLIAAIEQSVRDGRDGLGAIHVWAAGNGQLANDDVNLDGYANLRQTIATAAIDTAGRQTSYSEPGAAVFVSAISGSQGHNVVTTDLVGDRGLNAFADSTDGDSLSDLDYTSNFGGTSAAAPVVSGAVALMLEANPSLTWRDVQHILAETAIQNDPQDSDWTTNAAGFHVNHKYGFGALDAAAAVTTAKTWTNVDSERSTRAVISSPKIVSDDVDATIPLVVSQRLNVEWVEVTVDVEHSRRGDLEIVLTSPSGTESVLASPREQDTGSYNNWVFTSNRNWGETSNGLWSVTLRDAISGEAGRVERVQIDVYGTTASAVPDTGGDQTTDPDPNNPGDNTQTPDSGTGDNGGQTDPGSGGNPSNPDPGTGGGDSGAGSGGNNSGGNQNPPPVKPPPISTIRGVILESRDANVTANSRGIAGLSVYLDANNNGLIDLGETTTRTSKNGTFIFDQVPQGDYQVRMVPTAGWKAVTPETQSIALRSATVETTFTVQSYKDFGDAPFPYSTTQAQGGAVHAIDDKLFLGLRVDPDADGHGTDGANWDDVNGLDDEDGIVFASSLIPGHGATLSVTASRSGYLQGWIDYNADGDWEDAGEQILVNRRVPAGVSNQVIIVPNGVLEGTTYARFRIANQLNVQPNGFAYDGEVEDYVVLIGDNVSEIQAPVARNDSLVVLQDSSINGLNVLANDSIPLTGARIVSVDSPATQGAVVIGSGGGSLKYTPAVGFSGTEHFSYTIENLVGQTSTAIVTVDVTEVLDPPIAANDEYSIGFGSGPTTLSVLGNDGSTNGTLRIGTVSTPTQGGTVDISDDGKRLIYSPRVDYAGPEEFTYTAVDAKGLSSEATVSIIVSRSSKLVSVELVAMDASGNRLTNLRPGDEFTLAGYVTDTRSNPRGLFAAYVDVTYNAGVVEVVGDISHGTTYDKVVSGNASVAGLIDEVGGTTSIVAGLDGKQYLLFNVPMRATGFGNANFATDSADHIPASQVLLFGSDDAVDEQEVGLGKLSLPVRAFTNTEPLDANNDGSISPIDALVVINDLNTIGARALSVFADAALLPKSFVDVNGDNAVSPIDALMVINRLNSIARSDASAGGAAATGVFTSADVAAAFVDLESADDDAKKLKQVDDFFDQFAS
ncbi:MAG: S8 family serine peptidase [Planctomycetales bacterium]|nr:S8 family serine peptidase [Planctomycetales bacterium]